MFRSAARRDEYEACVALYWRQRIEWNKEKMADERMDRNQIPCCHEYGGARPSGAVLAEGNVRAVVTTVVKGGTGALSRLLGQ